MDEELPLRWHHLCSTLGHASGCPCASRGRRCRPRLVLRDGSVASVRITNLPTCRHSAVFPPPVPRLALSTLSDGRRTAGRAHRAAQRFSRSVAGLDVRRRTRVRAFGSSRRLPTSRSRIADSRGRVRGRGRFSRQRSGNGAAGAIGRGGGQPGVPPLPGHDARVQRGHARGVSRLGLRDSIEIRRRLYRRSVVTRGLARRRRSRRRTEPPGNGRIAPPAPRPPGSRRHRRLAQSVEYRQASA